MGLRLFRRLGILTGLTLRCDKDFSTGYPVQIHVDAILATKKRQRLILGASRDKAKTCRE
jgi:hypothetical protein